MPNFIFAYHGGARPEGQTEIDRVMKAWRDWMGGMGTALVDGGNPVGMSKTVTADGVKADGGANPLSGYSIVRADDMNAALDLAKGSPQLDGGTIEVAELVEM